MNRNSFKYGVRLKMEKDGWTVFPICDSEIPLELLCLREGDALGLRVKAHGHIRESEREVLRKFGVKSDISISYVRVNSVGDLVFETLRTRYKGGSARQR